MKKFLIVVALFIVFLSGVAAAGAFGIYTDTQYMSYGEVKFEQSELKVNDYELSGPGINVDEVSVTIDNPTDSDIEAEVYIYLMDDDFEVSTGDGSFVFDVEEEIEVIIDVDRVRESDFNSVDIRIMEI